MDADLTQSKAWQRVEEAHRRYEDAWRRLPIEDPELSLCRQEYIAALAAHRAVLERVRLPTLRA